ncbi:NAD(P)/FAD-dependent oxidoreductase [Nocardioides alcanivorans]|uniref:NAD(P)/FAD-dependent oxidoreductase n=1 Tax=Nocardioides alcanivorans TaxID=2897352 RepID=UPI001F4387A4|nr:FAD-dependent oxidoreductase [Nocardioides alcanivorans]
MMMEVSEHPERIAIVGASAAGLSAAETLRREGFRGGLTLIGSETLPPYKRPPLSKQVLSGDWSEERTHLRKEEELKALEAEWRLGVSASSLDRDNRRIVLNDGSTVNYDGLIVATGVAPRRLDTSEDLDGVHLLRTMNDARRMRDQFVAGRHLVVVGAGFLGCEVAAVARRIGMEVSLVDPLSAPMIRQLGSTVAREVDSLHAQHGTRIYAGVGVASLHGNGERLSEVRLTDGTVLQADLALVAIGSTPNVDWLRNTGLSLSNGVDCDAYCRAAPDIVAAGDVASWEHPLFKRRVRLEHQTNALEQGAAAAQALLGLAVEPFAPIPYFWSDQYNAKIQVYGMPHEQARTSIVRGEPGSGRFAAAYHLDGRLVAVLTWNMPRETLGLREELRSSLNEQQTVPTAR